MKILTLKDVLLDLVCPQTCTHCRVQGHFPRLLCPICEDALEQCRIPECELPGLTPEGRKVWATWYYRHESPIRTLHQLLKFHGRIDLGKRMAERMAGIMSPDLLPLAGACAAMPSHRARVLERGHLHTDAIACRLAELRSLKPLSGVLIRSSLTHSQSGLSREARIANMQGAFRVQGPLPNCGIVLVDDLMTTGATLDAAARELEGAGGNVTIVVAALRREVFQNQRDLTGSPQR